MESTRIIPFTGVRTTLPTPTTRADPDPTLIRLEIVNGRDQLSGGDAENAPRFAGEVHTFNTTPTVSRKHSACVA